MIINDYWLNKTNLKIKFVLKYLRAFNYVNGLFRNKNSIRWSSPCTCCYLCGQFFIKGKFGIKTEETKDTVLKGEPVKIIELKKSLS